MSQKKEISSTKKCGIRECPTSLARIIAAVNRLPENANEILQMLARLSIDINNAGYEEAYAKSDLHRKRINSLNLGKEVLDYLIGEMPGVIMLNRAAVNLNDLIVAKPVLLKIAGVIRRELETRGDRAFTESPHNTLFRAFSFGKEMLDIHFPGTLELVNGYIRPSLSGLPVIFQTEDVPLNRIRICPICRDIFWAKREESPACSDKDVSALNSRKTRIRKRIKELEESLEKELKKLEKNQPKLSPEHIVITKLKENIGKLQDKIERSKRKYAAL